MRLIELEPRWCTGGQYTNPDGSICRILPQNDIWHRGPMGIGFLCPKHRDHRLVVFFKNPVDGLPPADGYPYLWVRTGETFDTLTLAPSINAEGIMHAADGKIETPCWHGFITNGEIKWSRT